MPPRIGASDLMAPPLSDAPMGVAHPPLEIDPNADPFKVSGPGAPAMTKSEMAVTPIGKAIKSIADSQGGIGTVFIGDVAKKLGLPPNVLHEIIPSLVEQGLVNVHKSSMAEGRMSEERRAGALTIFGQRLHTMSLVK